MMRSIISVVLGYVLISVLIFGTLIVLEKTVPHQFGSNVTILPETKWVSLVLTLGFFYAMIGGLVTSWIAKRNERAHAIALSLIIISLSLVSFRYESLPQPLWYKFGVLFSGVAGVLLGWYWFSIIKTLRERN